MILTVFMRMGEFEKSSALTLTMHVAVSKMRAVLKFFLVILQKYRFLKSGFPGFQMMKMHRQYNAIVS